jgi:ATP-dependent protease ClpP protease subunit
MQEWQRNLRNANSWMLHFLKSQTGIDTSTIVHLMRNEITLTGREAVRYGFAQKVIEKEELFN